MALVLSSGVLPSGRKGRALALGLTLLVAAIAWLGAVAPLADWYADRAERLRRQMVLADRMAELVGTLPALRDAAGRAGESGHQPGALLAGATDPVAAAVLQQKLDAMAAAAGLRIGSEEILPAQAAGEFRAIAVRVKLIAPWRAVVALLEAMATADVPMMADEIQLRGLPRGGKDPELPIEANLTVVAYRAAGTGAAGSDAR